mgnify:CR=1 FL=1
MKSYIIGLVCGLLFATTAAYGQHWTESMPPDWSVGDCTKRFSAVRDQYGYCMRAEMACTAELAELRTTATNAVAALTECASTTGELNARLLECRRSRN